MSDLEVSGPTPEEMLAELKDLRAAREVGAQLLDAARARADQDNAALREATADRDRWQASAENLRSELWRQVDELRTESGEQRDQITQLSQALATLLEAIVGTTPSAGAVAAASELCTDVAAGTATVEMAADQAETPAASAAKSSVAPAPETPASPGLRGVAADQPTTEVLAEPVTAPAPASAPSPAPVVLSPYVPANEPPRPHLEPKPEPREFVPAPDHDRVGVFTELMAVAVDSVPEIAAGSPADRGAGEDTTPTTPSGMTILPAEEPAPAKRGRLRRLSG